MRTNNIDPTLSWVVHGRAEGLRG